MIAMLLLVVRVLIILLIVRIVLRWFAGRRVVGTRRTPPTRHGERLGGHLLRDPQCGTYVAEASAVKSGGHAFCSAKCRDAWIASTGNAARRSAS